MAKQTQWDLTLGMAGVLYLTLALFAGIDVPVMGLAVVVLSAYALWRRHSCLPRRDSSRRFLPSRSRDPSERGFGADASRRIL